jgi:hypothetical protein
MALPSPAGSVRLAQDKPQTLANGRINGEA